MNDVSTAQNPEDRFRAPDGSIDSAAVQNHLQTLQARAADLTMDEIREAIQLTRTLRRTNTTTGPAKRKTAAKPRISSNPDDLLDL